MKFKHLFMASLLAAATSTAGIAHAFNPQPDPPKALLLCEPFEGQIILTAFDLADTGVLLRIGMSCMEAASLVSGAVGKDAKQKFSVDWFSGTGQVSGIEPQPFLGIIVTEKLRK